MLKTHLLAAAAVLVLGASASAAAAQDLADRTATADLQASLHDLRHPARAEMDVENAETAAANGIEAQGRAVQADATPFAQAAAARTAILQREPTTQERAAIQQTEAAFQSSGA